MTEESTILTKEIGHLKGHSDWVTAIETGHPQKENEDTQVLITASRDRTILIWKFNNDSKTATDFGEPVQSLTGHSHFISDLALTNDNNYLLSSSWDRSMRLWDLRNGKTTQRFVEDGHNK
jgi:guanine nucleotide-binding protein subunit beta-2-like 1 protein